MASCVCIHPCMVSSRMKISHALANKIGASELIICCGGAHDRQQGRAGGIPHRRRTRTSSSDLMIFLMRASGSAGALKVLASPARGAMAKRWRRRQDRRRKRRRSPRHPPPLSQPAPAPGSMLLMAAICCSQKAARRFSCQRVSAFMRGGIAIGWPRPPCAGPPAAAMGSPRPCAPASIPAAPLPERGSDIGPAPTVGQLCPNFLSLADPPCPQQSIHSP